MQKARVSGLAVINSRGEVCILSVSFCSSQLTHPVINRSLWELSQRAI